ncbi:ABC transporter ATP-binding protein [Litorilinea aerophila]|nr:ABC transporter ATP-binding protein [Litorilinea aerophila]
MTRYMRPYRWVLLAGLVTTVLPVAMELVVPRMLQYVVDQGIRSGNWEAIWNGSLVMLVTALVGALATLGQGVSRAQLSQGIAYDLRNELFTHIQRLSFANLDQMQTGQLMTRISSDVDVVRMFLSAGLSLLLRALLMIIGSVIMLTVTDLQLSTIIFIMLAVAAVVIRSILRVAAPLFMVVQQKLAALNTIVQENLAGVQVVKAFVREPYEIERYRQGNEAYMAENIKVGRLMALAMPSLGLITNLGIVAVAWWGGLDTIGGRLSVGELIAFNNYLMIGMAPLLLLSNMLNMVSRAEASSTRILEVLDMEPAIRVAESPHTAEALDGAVRFDQVSFRYEAYAPPEETTPAPAFQGNGAGMRTPAAVNGGPNGNVNGHKDVLAQISFQVKPGQRIALLGATGSGKSTLVNLIPRFYEATHGTIAVDQVDVRQWSPHSLRRHIGMVMQQTVLFSGTVRENIAYGRPDASMEEVIAAAKAAQAHDFIMAMPQGYDSMVEARGANLSGGQKQRIAIARALLVSPGILILDDATSAVDMDTEFKIQEALDAYMRHCTTFIVAQRISSVLNADQIFILDGGQIVAQGTHRELLTTSPIYRDIFRSQFGEESLAHFPLDASQTSHPDRREP